ncbi:GrBNV gp93-like protein [Tomelloso virus]|uniref:GrBNV gp93-like protein n=1 Tax=Tomelloso virus TaxID=2053981 RepID=A0A2H4T2X7_9VIRU|nr:GrBNV gp93-like protein [Tomelloso virus]ATY70240.1 GrBNV gp93-like protein [Tomelloso virus]
MDSDGLRSWECHIHSSALCTMKTEYDAEALQMRYYHVIPIKNISVAAQLFNSRKVLDEFWEDFEYVPYFRAIAYTDCINDQKIFKNVMVIFQQLDDRNMKYSSLNTPSDFIKRHIITDGVSRICLCNKYLIKTTAKKGNAPQAFYTRNSWIKAILKLLFPKIDSTKEGIPTNTPQWALNLFLLARSEGQTKKING